MSYQLSAPNPARIMTKFYLSPRCAISYTVGPHAYQVTCLPSGSRGTKSFFFLVKELYICNGGSSTPGGFAGCSHTGCLEAMEYRWRRSWGTGEREGGCGLCRSTKDVVRLLLQEFSNRIRRWYWVTARRKVDWRKVIMRMYIDIFAGGGGALEIEIPAGESHRAGITSTWRMSHLHHVLIVSIIEKWTEICDSRIMSGLSVGLWGENERENELQNLSEYCSTESRIKRV